MSSHQMLFASYGQPLVVVDAADFNADRMTRGAGLTGASDSKSGILSIWLRLDGGDASVMALLWGVTGTVRMALFRNGANVFVISGDNAADSEILSMVSTGTYTAVATWRHVLASWDLNAAAGHLYINDVDDRGASTLTNDTIDYTLGNWAIGADPGGTNAFDGCLAEVYFAPGQYLDFSIVSNRRKFISSSGKPVYLGTDGSVPTGTAPIIYFHLDDGEAVANFAVNAGTDGATFTITGTLATGSTSPSD